ncbi:tetratricopeptide repeat protein, partial [Actinomyces dentalis]|uniref:tetratricopeptide repeat protein n=1 Tax=Actinomyces dentalis TaxID=272548 RepID=UPI0028EABFAA
DQAEAMFGRAIDADPNHANNLGSYAIFLKNVRREYDQAEAMFGRAIDADPNHADNLGNYAIFLKNVRHEYDQAKAMYERAIEANPNHANTLGNYSQLLFATGRDKTAIALVTRALPLASTDEKPLVAECRFYLFAHSPEHRRESGENLRDLLAAGVTTGSWSFEPNLERLRREKDPRYDLVRDVADALSSGDTQTLESRGEWYAL